MWPDVTIGIAAGALQSWNQLFDQMANPILIVIRAGLLQSTDCVKEVWPVDLPMLRKQQLWIRCWHQVFGFME